VPGHAYAAVSLPREFQRQGRQSGALQVCVGRVMSHYRSRPCWHPNIPAGQSQVEAQSQAPGQCRPPCGSLPPADKSFSRWAGPHLWCNDLQPHSVKPLPAWGPTPDSFTATRPSLAYLWLALPQCLGHPACRLSAVPLSPGPQRAACGGCSGGAGAGGQHPSCALQGGGRDQSIKKLHQACKLFTHGPQHATWLTRRAHRVGGHSLLLWLLPLPLPPPSPLS
jgi:hypothetical protein